MKGDFMLKPVTNAECNKDPPARRKIIKID
jgi:hypothetical protein